MLLAQRRRQLGLLGQLSALFGRGQSQPRNGEWTPYTYYQVPWVEFQQNSWLGIPSLPIV